MLLHFFCSFFFSFVIFPFYFLSFFFFLFSFLFFLSSFSFFLYFFQIFLLVASVLEFNCFLRSRCTMEMWCPDDIGRDSWDWVGPPAWGRACFNSPEWGGDSSPVKTDPLVVVCTPDPTPSTPASPPTVFPAPSPANLSRHGFHTEHSTCYT